MSESLPGPGSDGGAALTAAGNALRELALAIEHYRQTASAVLQLDVRQTQAVSYLYSRGAMGQAELAQLLMLNTSSVTALVDRLEAHRIARRTPHPTDRRRFVVELTEEGRSVISDTASFLLGTFDHVDAAELPRLSTVLSTMAQDLRRHTRTLAERLD
ncbi:MarR family winged helix-turn-helix transcriptional regulator [Nakamurella deserti]|uniref:MarR family winged helix-turn-helix transcriptional regulator n=1 Tax=Nakamurella deserti TaxID=2164074 RepID=UPI000DBE9415|nr:MarR family transcriptional regulator [Nakamurella deserti]